MNREEIKVMIKHCVYSEEGITYMSDKQYNNYIDIIEQLQKENKILRENAENNDKVVDKANWENLKLKEHIEKYEHYCKTTGIEELMKENKQLKELISAILNWNIFKNECPMNFGYDKNTIEDKAQEVFYENDDYCENNCNDDYKKCWLKYFRKMQELEKSDGNE